MKPALAFVVMFSIAVFPGAADAGHRCESESGESDAAGRDGGERQHERSAWHCHPDDADFDIDFSVFGWDEDEEETRQQSLDMAVFSHVDVRSKEPDYSHVEILEAPLVTVFESKRHPDERRLRVLDVPFFSLYESEAEAGESEMGVINVWPIGSLYKDATDGKKRRRTVLFLLRFETPVASTAPLGLTTLAAPEDEADDPDGD